ncbi:MAG: ribonuclease HI [Candidatus Hydrogenedentes bacterium]|nr:ribonuclease HI [Candidatus Hydrogenedentota bacterium]
MQNKLSQVEIYTDGGCVPNPGRGAWVAILVYKNNEKIIKGTEDQTTNNRMELKSAVEALKALKRPCFVRLYTDSEYLKKGMTEWLPKWIRRDWRGSKGGVKNIDLWKELFLESNRHKIEWIWIKGHNKHPYNERCDRIVKSLLAGKSEEN